MITVVIPSFKRLELLRQAILSVFAQDLDKDAYELIVVDSSPDESTLPVLRECEELAPCAFRYFRKKPEGPGPSRNLGVEHARGELIAFMDSDCAATPAWVRQGAAAFEDGIGIVQGMTQPNPAQRLGGLTRSLQVEQESCVYETANIFYRREAFDAAGGFMADLRGNRDRHLGGEDVDLAWRVKRMGWRTRFAPAALVYHEVIPVSLPFWLCNKTLYLIPWVAGRFPETRRFLFARYFHEEAQAWLVLAIAGLLAAAITPWSALAVLPYLWFRSTEKTESMKGIRRLVRVAAYVPRDLISLALLLAGSIRYRALVL